MKRQIEMWSKDKEMTTKKMYKMFKDYRELLDRAVRERSYCVALELKTAYRKSDWQELKRLVDYYNK